MGADDRSGDREQSSATAGSLQHGIGNNTGVAVFWSTAKREFDGSFGCLSLRTLQATMVGLRRRKD